MTFCPECESDLDLDPEELDEGEIVSCAECGTDFEVITVSPLELNRVVDKEDLDLGNSDEDGEA